MPLTFGNVIHPPFTDRLIPNAQTSAWDDLGPRQPVGVCQHSMVGSLWGTDSWFRRGRASTGLTDYGVGGATDGAQWDGVILRWNDPRGRRSGWANGGSDGLEGDGPLFVRTLGVAAINRDLVSIERSDGGNIQTPISPKQFASICALTAYWFDQARVPWDRFPLNPAHGIVTHFLHYEFATKACPFPPVTNRIDEIQARVRQILKAAQTGAANPSPIPHPPSPTTPNHDWWPRGYDLATISARFGVLTRHAPDGATTPYRFDPTGVISNAWVARGVQERLRAKELPRALHWWTLRADERQSCDLVMFADRWTLFRPDPNVGWAWID
ncbi:MAG: hypothetical protein ACRDJW_02360 [Thermomicrobiales bacterium]